MDNSSATFALHQLSNYLYRYYGKKVIILSDEYDTPMQEAYIHGYWDELVYFIRSLFNSTFKTNPYLEKGLMTGITRVSTSSNSLVGKLIREGNKDIKETFQTLLEGERIHCPIDEQIVYNQLDDNESAVWSLLLASGYLKVLSFDSVDLIACTDEVMYELALTNNEVLRMFYGLVRKWFGLAKHHYNDFVKALLRGDVEEMNAYMNRLTMKTFSYFDTGNSSAGEETERFYHGFVLGLLVDLGKEYHVTSNRESGLGRYDVMLEAKEKQKDSFILEFKVFNKKKEKTLEDTVTVALKQIEEMNHWQFKPQTTKRASRFHRKPKHFRDALQDLPRR